MPSHSGPQSVAQSRIPVVRTRNSVMRTSRRIIVAFVLGATPLATAGFAFDGAPANQDATIPIVAAQPGAANSLKKPVVPQATPESSMTPSSMTSDYAAEEGSPPAAWRLGRMYARSEE